VVSSEPLRSGPPGARVKAGTEVSGKAAMAADATQAVATRCQTPHVRAVVLMRVLWDPAQRSPTRRRFADPRESRPVAVSRRTCV
jgi:hypothetical protein